MCTLGKFTPFLVPSKPEFTTRQITSLPLMSVTVSSIKPSSIRTVEPTLKSLVISA